ncbi:MAG: type IV pilus assembly protein PilM [Bdellovibrionaceae bacterium]|nr:type IV pilus assembly protein PilM [Pseudobdellovibrionaceae bacterium]
MLFKNKKVLGIDLGSSSIKIAEIDVGRKVSTLQNFSLVSTPPMATSGGDIIDVGLFSDAVRQAINELGSKVKHASTGLWGSSIIIKKISIPVMEESLIPEQIRWEAEQYIPYDINEVNLAFKVLKLNNRQSDTMDILLIAAVQQIVYTVSDIVNSAGINCSLLDVSGFALANCFEANYGVLSGQVIGIINMGSSVTNFVIIDSGEVVFCRDIPVGGLIYTNELAKSLSVTMSEAEGMKLGLSSGQAVPEEASSIIENTHSLVLEEIGSSIEFFQNTSNSQLSKLYFTGGGSLTQGFSSALRQLLPAERLDPFLSVGTNPKVFSDQYIEQIKNFSAIAIGLGLRTLGDS